MNDEMKVRETLSALLDDEASELDLHRLGKQPLSADALARMRRYQAVRAVMAGQGAVATLDVSARISELVRQEPLPGAPVAAVTEPAPETPRDNEPRAPAAPRMRRQWFAGAAVAASVALAVVFSVQTSRDVPGESAPQLAQSPTPQTVTPYAPSRQLEPGLLARQPDQSAVLASAPMSPMGEPDMSEEHQRRLNNYLLRHAEQAARANGQSMVPYARLTGYEPAGAPAR